MPASVPQPGGRSGAPPVRVAIDDWSRRRGKLDGLPNVIYPFDPAAITQSLLGLAEALLGERKPEEPTR